MYMCKAKLVSKGLSQKPSIHSGYIYAPGIKYTALRMVLAAVAQMGLKIQQLDVRSAFLNELVKEEPYVPQKKGFEHPSHTKKLFRFYTGYSNCGRLPDYGTNIC